MGRGATLVATAAVLAAGISALRVMARRQVGTGRLVMGTIDHWPPVPRAPR